MALVAFVACSQPQEAAQEETEAPQEEVTAQDVQEEFSEAAVMLQEYGYEQREEFVEWSEGRLAELDAELDDLRTRAESELAAASETTRQEWQEAMSDLQAQRDELAASLQATGESSEEAWSEVRDGFLRAQEELASSLQRAAEEFESGDASQESSS